MSAVGQLIGYVIGSIDTVSVFGTSIGDTQFKQMTVIAALALLVAVTVTSYSVKERVLITPRWDDVVSFHQNSTDLAAEIPTKRLELYKCCHSCSKPLWICPHESKPFAGLSFGRGLVICSVLTSGAANNLTSY
jgi:hypothetical protein